MRAAHALISTSERSRLQIRDTNLGHFATEVLRQHVYRCTPCVCAQSICMQHTNNCTRAPHASNHSAAAMSLGTIRVQVEGHEETSWQGDRDDISSDRDSIGNSCSGHSTFLSVRNQAIVLFCQQRKRSLIAVHFCIPCTHVRCSCVDTQCMHIGLQL